MSKLWALRFRRCIIFLVPFLASPLVFYIGTKEAKCGYVSIIMACYWLTECIPLPITALLPIVLFPWLDIMGTARTASAYTKPTTMLSLGGLIMAVAIEDCNLHKRMSMRLLLLVGEDNKRLLAGFLTSTCFLSMWISNTATAAIFVPIVEAVLKQSNSCQEENVTLHIQHHPVNREYKDQPQVLDMGEPAFSVEESSNHGCLDSGNLNKRGMYEALFLSVAYGANIGGTGTLTGTGPNLVLYGIMEELFPSSSDITFSSWMLYGVPEMIVCVVFAWIVLYFTFIRNRVFLHENSASVKEILRLNYEKLGPISFREAAILSLFVMVKIIWFLQDPRFMEGWSSYVNHNERLSGATLVLTTTLLLFILPRDIHSPLTSPALLDWRTAKAKTQWGVVLLLGGGFALSEAFKYCGLSRWLSNELSKVPFTSPEVLCLSLCVLAAIITEFTSNVVTAAVLLPVVGQLGISLGVHPLYLMLPVTICCSFAFILPAATPPNAIICQASGIKTSRMIIPGLLMNLLCCVIAFGTVNSLGIYLFNLKQPPEWLGTTESTVTSSGNYTLPFLLGQKDLFRSNASIFI